MKTNIFHKYYKFFIVLLGVLLFTASIITLTISNFLLYRFLRGFICFVFLGLIILFQKKESNPLLLMFLVLYGASSLLTIWYENNSMATLSMGLNVLSFVALIRAILPKVSSIKINSFFIVSFAVMILLNGFLGYQLIAMFKGMTLSKIHFIFIVLNTLGIVFISFLGLIYNHRYSTKSSLIFVSFILLLLFSEVFRGIAYYELAYGDYSAHIARGLLIISLALLMHYSFLKKNDDELLNARFF
ncbi:MAG: hypothetical protein IMY67_05930 [Bacteroidetes bacterium]|nr:hypothetical protein [Bacteroidota bacterium]